MFPKIRKEVLNMKTRNRFVSVILTLCMMIPLLGGSFRAAAPPPNITVTDKTVLTGDALPDIIDEAEAIDKGYVERLTEEESNLNTLIFQNQDGTKTLRLFDFPVKYTEDGVTKDITLDIEPMIGGYVSAQSPIEIAFASALSSGISLSYEDLDITMIPLIEANSSNHITATAMASLSSDQRTVSYAYGTNTTLEYQLTYAGFKEDIVVTSYTGQTEYSFLLQTNGLTLTLLDGSYVLIDGDGTVRATIGDIIIFTADERNNAFGTLTHQTVKENHTYLLTIGVDADYLADEKTVYPIRIDPTIEVNYADDGAGAIEDVTINSNSGSAPNSTSLMVGKRETYGISRVLMRFPGLSLTGNFNAQMVISATVELRDIMCYSTPLPVSCHIFTGSAWDISTVTWANCTPNGYTATALDSRSVYYGNGNVAANRYGFDITAAVKAWMNGTASKSRGILFKTTAAIENGSSYSSVTFASYNRSSNQPSLTLTYQNMAALVPVPTCPYSAGTSLSSAGVTAFFYTPSKASTFSAWTDSAVDTTITVYMAMLFGSQVDYDDNNDDGIKNPKVPASNDTDACLTLTLMPNVTYYFVVQGKTTNAVGAYTFYLYEGLPLSGSEQPANIELFNSATYGPYGNCYTYALNALTNPITDNPFSYNDTNPGLMDFYIITPNQRTYLDLSTAELAKASIISGVLEDCQDWGGTQYDFYEVNAKTRVPEGYYKVALVLAEGKDYHWFRQASDLEGRWAHKHGKGGTTTTVDDTGGAGQGNPIVIPENAYCYCTDDYGGIFPYSEFLGYFAIKPPSAYD